MGFKGVWEFLKPTRVKIFIVFGIIGAFIALLQVVAQIFELFGRGNSIFALYLFVRIVRFIPTLFWNPHIP